MSDWRQTMTESSRAFCKFVWPVVRTWCRPGQLVPVESPTAQGLLRDFDTRAGIDAWHIIEDDGMMRGIASRVQEGETDWRTFTVRKSRTNGAKTEFAKRMEAIRKWREGYLWPALTIQSYVQDYSNGPLLSVAIVNTVDLYEYLEKQIDAGRDKTKSVDNAEFYYIYWRELDASGVRVRTQPPIRTNSNIA